MSWLYIGGGIWKSCLSETEIYYHSQFFVTF